MGILLYAVAWFLFAVTHSLLARVSIQQKIENYLGCLYRLAYNVLALFSIGIVLLCGRTWLVDSRYHFFETTLVSIFCFAVQLIGFAVLIIAFARYDIGRFVGITQLVTREKVSSVSNEPLQRNGLNRYMRHPLYTGAFLVLWGGAVSSLGIWTAIFGTLYFLIGSLFEERKLVRIYGDDYRKYQQEVPRYFPYF